MQNKILSLLVDNTSGVLSRIAGMFSRRGYNIDSITAGVTADVNYTRITVVCSGDDAILDQIVKQLAKLVDVRDIKVLDPSDSVVRETVLVKVAAAPEQRQGIVSIADIFRAKVVDVSKDSLIVEMTGSKTKLEAFIPVMESNGLITELDMKVWEQVCQTLQDWIKSGHKVIPISVNVSSVDIYAIDVVEHFKNLVRKYGLPPEYVELEITESAYVEEYKVITGVAEALRNAGFTVLMDDFGSGYSSLNMLKDVNVDVLKIDMKFLKMDENTMDKGMGILEAVTRMANIMGLRMIAEGVETEDQINYLLNMGCIYGQGYFFYKPLPVEEIKALLNDENNVDYRGIQARKIEHVRFKDLFQSELASDSILNNILGPIAIYDVYCDNVELLQVNDKYCLLVGQDPVDLAENVQVMEAIHPDDRKKMQNIFQRSFQRLAEGAEGTVRRRREDGQYIWINIKAFFLREQDGHKMFYGAVRDVSEEMNQFQKLMFYQNRGN